MKNSEEKIEFEKSTLKEWVTKIENDLKGASIEDLRWSIDEKIDILPYQHFENHKGDQRIANSNNGWLIGETFRLRTDHKSLNRELLLALKNGVNAPELIISKALTLSDYDELFREIILDYISPSLVFDQLDVLTESILELDQYLTTANLDKNHNQLRIHYSGSQNDLIPIFKKLGTIYPGWKFFTFFESTKEEDISKSISSTKLLNETIAFITRHQLLEKVNTVSWRIKSGPSYYTELSRLRAMRWCWGLFLESVQIEDYSEPFMDMSINIETENPNKALISATIETLSALQGGVHKISVTPDTGTENFQEYQRLGRNIQNIMQLESKLDKVSDPAEGSYYLEMLTEKIAAAIWKGVEF